MRDRRRTLEVLPDAQRNSETASHRPLEGGDWRERRPAQMVRPSPIVTFDHKWGHDALEETESAPARIPRFNVGVGGGGGGGGGDCMRRCQSRDDEHKDRRRTLEALLEAEGKYKTESHLPLGAGTGAGGARRRGSRSTPIVPFNAMSGSTTHSRKRGLRPLAFHTCWSKSPPRRSCPSSMSMPMGGRVEE